MDPSISDEDLFLLISDANILIDLEEGQLLDVFFRLPYQFKVPDILFEEELKEQHSGLLEYGLLIGALSSRSMQYAYQLKMEYSGVSTNDCLAIALAKQEQCPLLTGDMALRKTAEIEAIIVKGTLWVVEQLVIHQIINKQAALYAYDLMACSGRRLPWQKAKSRIEQL